MVDLGGGASAAAPGVLWLHASRAVVAADVHFAYEDVVGAALPLWSTVEIVEALLRSVRDLGAEEIVLLGDVIHGSRMSQGAAATVQKALRRLRNAARLTIVAGNHEGRSRGAAVLGETVEFVSRDGWTLLHGDKAPSGALLSLGSRWIVGHLHPSLALGGRAKIPAFLAGHSLIVVPALTPYSGGLDVQSDACLNALRGFNIATRAALEVVAVTREQCYPFGSLAALGGVLRGL